MTPITPYGWYSRCEEYSICSSELGTRRGPRTFRACFAAHATWSMAPAHSTIASASGLPVSSCMSAASSVIRLARLDRNRSSRSRRAPNPRPAHQVAAARARSTAAATSAGSATGNRPTSSPVAGLVETSRPSSTKGRPGVRVAVMGAV